MYTCIHVLYLIPKFIKVFKTGKSISNATQCYFKISIFKILISKNYFKHMYYKVFEIPLKSELSQIWLMYAKSTKTSPLAVLLLSSLIHCPAAATNINNNENHPYPFPCTYFRSNVRAWCYILLHTYNVIGAQKCFNFFFG